MRKKKVDKILNAQIIVECKVCGEKFYKSYITQNGRKAYLDMLLDKHIHHDSEGKVINLTLRYDDFTSQGDGNYHYNLEGNLYLPRIKKKQRFYLQLNLFQNIGENNDYKINRG